MFTNNFDAAATEIRSLFLNSYNLKEKKKLNYFTEQKKKVLEQLKKSN